MIDSKNIFKETFDVRLKYCNKIMHAFDIFNSDCIFSFISAYLFNPFSDQTTLTTTISMALFITVSLPNLIITDEKFVCMNRMSLVS